MLRLNILIGGIAIATLIAIYVMFRPIRYKSKYYDASEFDSPDLMGSGANMHPDTLRKLDNATAHFGSKFTINSGFRTQAHNENVGGVAGSSHTKGRAIDIATNAYNQEAILDHLKQAGFRRIGIYTHHVHVDDDPQKPDATWRQ